MYDTDWQSGLRGLLDSWGMAGALSGEDIQRLLEADLALYLLETLELLDSEPVCVIWALLSGIPLPGIAQIAPNKRKALSNARVLLKYSGRARWENDLRFYGRVDARWRSYTLDPHNLQRFSSRLSY